MVDKRIPILAILAGGPLAGVLLAAALPPQLKVAPESPWRTAARDKALEVDSYAFVDTSFAGSGPQMPWLHWMGPPQTAPFREDYYRGQATPIFVADDDSLVRQASYEPERTPAPEAREDLELATAAEEADETAEQLQPPVPQQAQFDPGAEESQPIDEAYNEAESDFGG